MAFGVTTIELSANLSGTGSQSNVFIADFHNVALSWHEGIMPIDFNRYVSGHEERSWLVSFFLSLAMVETMPECVEAGLSV